MDGAGTAGDKSASELTAAARMATLAARTFAAAAKAAAEAGVVRDGRIDVAAADRDQRLLHGFAWIATTVEAIAATTAWAEALLRRDALAAGEALVLAIGLGEYLHQLAGGIPMSQNEMVRPGELGLAAAAASLAADPAVAWFMQAGNVAARRAALVEHLADGGQIDEALGDETLDLIRGQFRRFADQRVLPGAHGWHLADELIPDAVVAEMAEMGYSASASRPSMAASASASSPCAWCPRS